MSSRWSGDNRYRPERRGPDHCGALLRRSEVCRRLTMCKGSLTTDMFWGDAIHHAGAGPAPIPFKELTMDRLAEAFSYAVSPGAKVAAGKLGEVIRSEQGEAKGADSFHKHLPHGQIRLVCASAR